MVITDSQIHLWAADTPERPWPVGHIDPHRPAPMAAEEALFEMDRAGVARAVIIPPIWVGNNNEVALQAARDYPDRLAVMGRIDIESPSEAALEHWREQPGMLGVRLTHRSVFLDDVADWFWPVAERLGLPVMVLKTGHTALIGEVAAAFPGLRLIIDHLNLPWHQSHLEIGIAIGELLALARYPNVAVKVSALPSRIKETYPFPSLRPLLERVIGEFGADRCMWGSDLTHLSCPYIDWVRVIPEADFLSEEEKALVMGGTLSRWLEWPEAEVNP